MRAHEIMTKDVCTVGPETPIVEIAQRLTERRISAVPVVDMGGHVLGIVSEGDLIRRPEIGTEPRRSWWLDLIGSDDDRAREYTKTHGAVPTAAQVAILVPVVVAAHIAGRPLFRLLARSGSFDRVVTAILLVSVVAGLVTALV